MDNTDANSIQHVDNHATTTETTDVQKLKDNFRLVIDKLNEICKVNTVMLSKLKSLSEENESLINENDKLYDELYELKVDLTSLDQYGRRENVEICNIPESVTQEQLQKHVIDVMKSVNVIATGKDIHAIHRLGTKSSRPRNVIVRFVNRKTAFTLLKNKKQLGKSKYKNYYVTENLCPVNKKIFNILYKRKKNNELHSLWTYNGNVFVKVKEGDHRVQVQHLDDIEDLFTEDDRDDCSGSDGSDAEAEEEHVEAKPVASDDPANIRKDHGLDDSLLKGRRRSFTISKTSKSHPRRRLSMVKEDEEVLRTPIPPMVIHI